jgi:hypothetical protein
MDLGGNVEVFTSDGLHASPQIFEWEMNILVPGVRMFSVSLEPGTEHIGLSTLAEELGSQLFHKVFPGLITPFGLPIECFPIYEAMLEKNPSLEENVNVMLQGAVAESTSLQYGAVVREFHQFCVAEKKVFPHFTEFTVLEFVSINFSRPAFGPISYFAGSFGYD